MNLGGVAGPLLFAVVVVVTADLQPEYDHMSQLMSELGASDSAYSALMNIGGFMIPAVFILLFAMSLARWHFSSSSSRMGSILIALFAVAMFSAGLFSCDPGCQFESPSTHQIVHRIVSLFGFVCLVSSTFFWGSHLRRISSQRRFAVYTLVTGLLAIVLLVLVVLSVETRTGTGLFQRLFIGALLGWLAVFSWRIERGYHHSRF
jgi:hypothetical membrane protein